jgi:hypothetical protein
MSPRRSSPQALLGLLLVTVLGLVMPVAAQCNNGDTGAPCFVGNPDMGSYLIGNLHLERRP